ncbi:MAG: GDSL-type esterase/lipase family protein, partial [Fidelibacterota bacterium]
GHTGNTVKIKWVNGMLKDWCDDNEIIFVNLFIHLKNENDDFLNPEFTYDGLHLNGSGYQKWANVIRPLIK